MNMTTEQFDEIKKSLEEGKTLDLDQHNLMVETISRLDMTLYVVQNALQLMSDNIATIIPELAQAVQKRCGRTEQKISRAVGEMAASAVAIAEEKVNSYVIAAFMAIAESLNIDLADLFMSEQEADTAPADA